MESQGVILPSTVDPVTGRRTDLNIEVNEKLPRESLMFLQSTFHTCPDILHMIVRSVESDLKLHVDALLKLEDLIAKDDFKTRVQHNREKCQASAIQV